jgi:putative solute:sodium symporter small subunit
MAGRFDHERYWRVNKRIIGLLLAIWFMVSFVLGIFLVKPLNQVHLGGFPLGFWIAHQGAIYVFILLIGVYCLLMEREDRKYHVEESEQADP